MLQNVVKNSILKVFVVFALFVVCSPILMWMLRPQDDIGYHLIGRQRITVSDASSIESNQFVHVSGKVKPSSVRVIDTSGFLDDDQFEFTFQLEDFGDNVIFHIAEGPLHGALTTALSAHGLSSDDFEKPLFQTSYLAVPEGALGEVCNQAWELEGRSYQSDRSPLGPFEHYYRFEETAPNEYIKVFLRKDPKEALYWMIAVNESPSSTTFQDTNGATFLFGMGLGIPVVLFMAFLFFGPSAEPTVIENEFYSITLPPTWEVDPDEAIPVATWKAQAVMDILGKQYSPSMAPLQQLEDYVRSQRWEASQPYPVSANNWSGHQMDTWQGEGTKKRGMSVLIAGNEAAIVVIKLKTLQSELSSECWEDFKTALESLTLASA